MTRKGRRLFKADIAKMLGMASHRSLTRSNLPEPNGYEPEAGHARPWWWESTITAWIAARPGKGWRAGKTRVSA